MEKGGELKSLLLFQIRRKSTDLTKEFLIIIEDLMDDGYVIPEDKYNKIRKRCLDKLNDSLRELETVIDKVDVTLK